MSEDDAVKRTALDDMLIRGVVVVQVMKVWDDRLPF